MADIVDAGVQGLLDLVPVLRLGDLHAGDREDVAAVEGRIVRQREREVAMGCVDFGASRHVARIILAALRFDPRTRAAVNIRYSEKVLAACRETGLTVSSFEREKEPENVSSMDWGTTEAIRAYGSVPNVIYDEGGTGKEPMVRLLGTSATEIAKLAVKLAGSLE